MKLIVSVFWSVVIGAVVGYIMTALEGVSDNMTWSLIIAAVFGVFVYLFSNFAVEKETQTK